ncbi:MAG: DUF4340 domain-containing protein [Oscillospiraceae bacterium]|nr:DUF4340 domain-containing protein [Oscillospiraceae bacterium]
MRKSVLITCIIAVLLLSAGIVFLMLWDDEPEVMIETPPVEAAQTADLIRESREYVVSITFTPNDGTEYTILHNADDGGLELNVADPIFSGEQSALRSLFNQAVSLPNLTVVTEDADDEQLAMFGFNNPDMSVSVARDDGTTVEIEIGNVQAVGQGRFARLGNSREVFLLSGHQSAVMTQSVEQLYDIAFFPFWEYHAIESAVLALENIIIENDRGIIELRRRAEEEIADLPLGSSSFQILQPTVAEANDSIIERVILQDLISIRPTDVVSVRPTDLSAYGLDSPVRLTIEAYDWHGATLLIGNADHDRGGRFVMIEGYDAVLFDYFGEYEFLNISFAQIRTGHMWLYHIEEIASITFMLDGATRILRMEHNPDDESLRGWLDDTEISETNVRRLYTGALLIAPNGETDAPIPSGDPMYSITIYFADGDTRTLELYQLNDSQFMIVLNGENTELFITRMSLQINLLSRFEALDAGRDIPAG